MDVKKSLIALSISSVLMAGAWTTAVAKTAEEDDSVYRWGRWAVLAPAAGNEEVIAFAPAGTNDLGRCESAANCPSPNTPSEEPEPPVATSPCEAGMPCGFARVDTPYDVLEESEPEDSQVVPFSLAMDEEANTLAFVVDQGSAGEIQSGTVPAVYGKDGTTVDTTRGSTSVLHGILNRTGTNPVVAQGGWSSSQPGSGEGGSDVNGGEFVWGITATVDQMQSLISSLGGDMTAVYQGITMGTTSGNEGTVRLDINFGSATWSGEFNGNVAFTASGDVINSGFVSSAGGFSSNIASGEVKGGFVNAGANAIGGYEVTTTEGISGADVFNTVLQTQQSVPAFR